MRGADAHEFYCALLAARVKVVRHNRLRFAVEKIGDSFSVADEISGWMFLGLRSNAFTAGIAQSPHGFPDNPKFLGRSDQLFAFLFASDVRYSLLNQFREAIGCTSHTSPEGWQRRWSSSFLNTSLLHRRIAYPQQLLACHSAFVVELKSLQDVNARR